MPKAHQAVTLAAILGRRDEAGTVIVLVVNGLEHLHDGGVGATVQRSGQGIDAGGERSKKVRAAGTNHAHGRGAAILLVVGVHQQNEVERLGDLGNRHIILIWLREHLVQEVIAERQVFGMKEWQAARMAVDHRADRADFGNSHRRREVELLEVLLEIVGGEMRVMRREGTDDGRQHRHRGGIFRETLENLLHLRLDGGVGAQEVAENLPLFLARQFAVDDEVGGLDEIAVPGELVDRITAVAQDAVVAIQEGDGALARAGVAVALVVKNIAGVLAEVAGVDGVLALRPRHHGTGDFLIVELEEGGLLHEGVKKLKEQKSGRLQSKAAVWPRAEVNQ